MNKQVKLGVIGTGPRGSWLARMYAAHPLCKVVALCDNVRATVELAASELGDPDVKCYTDFERMIASEALDAVVIAAPPDIQVDMACFAMDKGIHVTTEVPAAYTMKQCWDLVNAVEKNGVKYQLSEQVRYWGFIQEWREMARRGEFGHILFVEGEYLHYAEWDFFLDPETGERLYGIAQAPEGRNVVETWRYRTFKHPIFYLPHTLSPLLSITGGRITRVSCMGTRSGSYHMEDCPVRDMEVALMHTDGDTIFRVAAGFTSPHGPRKETGCHWYHVKGSKRTVEWSRSLREKPKMWTPQDNDWQEMDWSLRVSDASDYIKRSGHGGSDGWPSDFFLRAITEDTDVPMDVYAAVETAAPAILAAESADEGGALKIVPDFRKRGQERE